MAEGKKLPEVFKHYIVPDSTEGQFTAHCKYSKKELTGTKKSTTNWWKHLVSIFMGIFYFYGKLTFIEKLL